MPRSLRIDDDALTIEYSGLLVLGTLQRRVRVPWKQIRSVRADAWPRREADGRFRRAGRRLFLAFDDPRRVVRLNLAGGGAYDEVVVGADDPRRLVAEIAARLSPAPARAA
jgi:hypothetical protein